MSDLVVVREAGSSLPAVLLASDLESADYFASRSKSQATIRAYRADWDTYCRWCGARNVPPMPATPDTVRAFIASRAEKGIKAREHTNLWGLITKPLRLACYHHL